MDFMADQRADGCSIRTLNMLAPIKNGEITQQAKLQNLTEQFILLFCANFLFKGNALEMLRAAMEISEASGPVRVDAQFPA